MISGANQCFPHHHPQVVQLYEGVEDLLPSSGAAAPAGSDTLLYSLSVLRDKFQQLQSLVGAVVRPDRLRRHSAAAVVSGAGALIQEIIVAASSMMYPLQQVALGAGDAELFNIETHYNDGITSPNFSNRDRRRPETPSDFPAAAASDIIDQEAADLLGSPNISNRDRRRPESPSDFPAAAAAANDIIELEAADLLGKCTHYCHVCGKGFKRDANLRMHMRAHGDEYKTAAALRNPAKGGAAGDEECSPFPPAARKYSCPEEGCRWNRGHARFQPLKSVVCVKNHYRRSHCPKLHVCRRCERKRFSVLSDLRTHEKHCGDRKKWRCTCGTTFSRKDKLMGHVALFAGHAPALDRSMVQGEE